LGIYTSHLISKINSDQIISVKLQLILNPETLEKYLLVPIAFYAKNRFAFTNNEIINCLPCDYFPKHALEELTLKYFRGKSFS